MQRYLIIHFSASKWLKHTKQIKRFDKNWNEILEFWYHISIYYNVYMIALYSLTDNRVSQPCLGD